jgi:hypothetical protein
VPSKETGDGLEPRMPPGHRDIWTSLREDAKETARFLALSWKRSDPRSPAIERMALHHAVRLEMRCETATRIDSMEVPYYPMLPLRFPLRPELGTPRARYDVEAACRMIPRLLPYSDLDLQGLRSMYGMSIEYDRPSTERASELFAYWHNWVWNTRLSVPDSTEAAVGADRQDFGQSSELALASSRLAAGLKVVLGSE